jgi:hypothetical protein
MRGFEALELCGGPTNTAIVRTMITASHHGCQHSHAARSWPTVAARDEQRRVIWMRWPAMNCSGRDDANLRAVTNAAGISGIAAPLAFAARGVSLKPSRPADAVARRNRAAARMFLPVVANPRRALTLSHRGCAIGSGRCIGVLAAFRLAPTGKTRSGLSRLSRQQRSAPAAATGIGADRFAVGQIGPAGGVARRAGAAQLAKVLEAAGNKLRSERPAVQSRRDALRSTRTLCRGDASLSGHGILPGSARKSPLQVNPRARALRFVGWLRRPG